MKIKTLALLALLSLTTACGFQLRGSLNLADHIEPIYIGGEANSELGISIRKLLNSNDIQLADSATAANYQLILLEQRSDRRTLSLAADASAAEYQLSESASFRIDDKQGRTVLGPKTIDARRIMRNDPDRVVSKGEEEALLRREMQQDLAGKIARQLTTISQQP